MEKRFRLNGDLRDFMVDDVKAPLVEGLGLFLSSRNPIQRIKGLKKLYHSLKSMEQLPYPTRENTTEPNSLILIDTRDEIISKLKLPLRIPPIVSLINFAIIMRYDEPYKQLMDQMVDRLRASAWQRGDKPDILIWKQDWETEKP